PSTVRTTLAGKASLPLSLPPLTAARTACSISRCEVMPTFLRNLRTLTFSASSFMIASRKCRKDGCPAYILSMWAPQNDGQNAGGEPLDNGGQIGKVLALPVPWLPLWPAKIPQAARASGKPAL